MVSIPLIEDGYNYQLCILPHPYLFYHYYFFFKFYLVINFLFILFTCVFIYYYKNFFKYFYYFLYINFQYITDITNPNKIQYYTTHPLEINLKRNNGYTMLYSILLCIRYNRFNLKYSILFMFI